MPEKGDEMAQNRFVWAAPYVAQAGTLTVGGTPAAGQVYSVTMGLNNACVVSYTAVGGDTNITIASALQALLAASQFGQFQEITFDTTTTAVIPLTAATAGTPFTLSTSATGTGTLVYATTTPNSSPEDWGNAANWSTGALPIAGDDVWIDDSTQSIRWNLAAISATLNSVNISSTMTGTIGLPEVNTNGSNSYEEYRTRYLTVNATTINVGYGSGTGSSRININSGTVQTALFVRQTGQSLDTNLEALQWKGTNVSNTVEVTRGSVGIAGLGGDAATVATLTVGYVSNQDSDATVRCGQGTTLTTVNMSGGSLDLYSGCTTLTKTAGTLTTYGTGAYTTLAALGGTTNCLSTGTIGTLTIGSTETLSFAEDDQARTVTNCTLYAGGSLSDPFKTVTWTNPIQLAQCRIADVTLDLGVNRRLAPS